MTAITKCLIRVPPVNWFTVAVKVLSQCDGSGTGGSVNMCAATTENIMTKAGDASQDRELQDDELEAVIGGIIAVLIGLLLSDARPSTPSPPASK